MCFRVITSAFLITVLAIYEVRAVGVVTVGVNATTPQDLIVFTENVATPKLRVILSDSSGATPDVIGVTVYCRLDANQPTGLPFTTASIANKSEAAVQLEMDITFTTSGRPVSYSCYATGSKSFNNIKSKPFLLQRKKAPTVSICSPVTAVPQQSLGGNFRLLTSDAVVNSDVNITCTANLATAASLNVTTSAIVLATGSGGVTDQPTPVTFTVSKKGGDNTVACTGQSADNVQYQTNNSKGTSTRLTMGPLTAKLIPERLTTGVQSFQLLLSLGAPVTKPEAFLCSVVQVADNAAENAAVANAACNTATSPGSTNSTNTTQISWSVTHRADFSNIGATYQPVTVTRSLDAIAATTERLVVTCCANPSESNSIYFGTVAAARVTAKLAGKIAVNASTSNTVSQETVLPNPAFENPAPCPCDLTPDVCDLGCCCDTACDAAAQQLQPCFTGYFGGNLSSLPTKPHRCELSAEQQTEDYHALMCIMYENNAVLGQFYTPTATKLSADAVRTRVSQSSSSPQFLNDGVRTQATTTAPTYKVGAAVNIYWNEGNADSTDQTADLTLPGAGIKGSCNRGRVVRFLRNHEARCDISVTNRCSKELSARSYLVGGNLTHPACPVYPAVRAAIGSTFRVPTEVEYYCVPTETSLVGSYLKSTASALPSTTSSSSNGFNNAVNCTYLYSNDSVVCTQKRRLTLTPSIAPLTFTRCTFDDGYSLPPEPSFNPTTQACDNAVLNVSYAFAWNQTSITALRVFVLMASVPVQQTLSQAFSVNFTYGDSAKATPQLNPLQKRSGVFGYDNGKPLIGGKRVGTAPNQYVDANITNWPFTFIPSSDRLCEEAGTEPVLFPYNSDSSCKIYIKNTDFSDCTKLRANLLTYLDLLVPFNVLATYGSPDTNTASDWVDIIQPARPTLKSTKVPLPSRLITRTVPAPSIPDNTTSNSTNGTTPTPTTTTTVVVSTGTFGEFLPTCLYVPVGMVINVLFANQGKARSEPIYQIVGVKKDYMLRHIELNCPSSGVSACRDQNIGQQQFLDLKFIFKQVPANWNTNSRNLYTHGILCWWDICIEDVFALWTNSHYYGMRLETIGYSLFILLVGIPVLFAAWPW